MIDDSSGGYPLVLESDFDTIRRPDRKLKTGAVPD